MKTIYLYITLFIISFALHFLWESSHVSLYGGYEDLSGPIPLTLFATLGDVLYVFFAVVLVSLFKRNIHWFQKTHFTDYLGLFVIGASIAVYVEYKAFVFDRWFYLDAMPIIPGLEVGLSPVLQMSFLLPLSVFVTSYLHRVIFFKGYN